MAATIQSIHPLEHFKKELAHFEEIRDRLLRENHGQYALIKGHELVGTYSTSEEAYHQGLKIFKRESFLIKHIVEEEAPAQIPALYTGTIGADF